MFFCRSWSSSDALLEVVKEVDGVRGWERARIWEERKESLRSMTVGGVFAILVLLLACG